MFLSAQDVAKMIDLSCVRTMSNKRDIEEMVSAAKEYQFGQVSVMQCFIPYTKQLLAGSADIHIVGNVSFPSGSDSTKTKVFQAQDMKNEGCDEIDVVLNIGKLRSGMIEEVQADLNAVIQVVNPLPVKVIIEVMYLTPAEIEQACAISVAANATFVKTGTGWADRPTSLDDVKLIKSFVGDKAKIKASGGIRNLETLVAMYQAGARRFGVNLKSGISIVKECMALPKGVEV
jgi:deoxyribose-phosphate aldolase